MKPSGIGGMAVIEGVMMKNKDEYAVAVRKPDNEIVVEKSNYMSFSEKVKLFKLPIFRGMLAFVDSMVLGVKILSFSASFFEEEEVVVTESKNVKINEKSTGKKTEKKSHNKAENKGNNVKASTVKNVNKNEKNMDAKKDGAKNEQANALLMAAAVVMSIGIAVLFFMVLPVLAAQLFSRFITNHMALSVLEGVLRILIFIGYVTAVSQMPDIKSVFMYHGAEHKTINCLENGFELNVENVKWQSKLHKRCGTSFMLIVMMISVIFFIFVPVNNIAMRILTRILLVPIIAGVSYEFIRLAGKSESKLVDILSKPGMWMQGLTTREPDDSMIEVAIKSVESVFDWKAFLDTELTDKKLSKKEKNKIDKKLQPVVADGEDVAPKVEDIEEEEDDILKALDTLILEKMNLKCSCK